MVCIGNQNSICLRNSSYPFFPLLNFYSIIMSWDPNPNWDPYNTNFQPSYDDTYGNYWDPNVNWSNFGTSVEDVQSSHDATVDVHNWDFDYTNDGHNQAQNETVNEDETSASNRVLLASVGAVSSTYFHTYLVKEPCRTSTLTGYLWLQELEEGKSNSVLRVIQNALGCFL